MRLEWREYYYAGGGFICGGLIKRWWAFPLFLAGMLMAEVLIEKGQSK